MKKTTEQIAKELLLSGRHINKFDFLSVTNSVCLAQRINDIQKEGWDIRRKSIKGKGNLIEYWLDPDEIERISNVQMLL